MEDSPPAAPKPKARGYHTEIQKQSEQAGLSWWSSAKITRSKTRPPKEQRAYHRAKRSRQDDRQEESWGGQNEILMIKATILALIEQLEEVIGV